MFSGLWKSQDSHSFLSMTHVPIFVRLCSGDLNSSNDVKASIWFYVCFLSYPVSECLGDPCKWLEGNLPQYKTFFLHCNWICRSVIIHVPVTVVWWEPYINIRYCISYTGICYTKRGTRKSCKIWFPWAASGTQAWQCCDCCNYKLYKYIKPKCYAWCWSCCKKGSWAWFTG